MRRQTLADQLTPFEVFPDHALSVGRPIVARLVGRRFDQLLDGGRYDRPFDVRFGKAMVKTISYLAATLGASFGYCERVEMSLYALANGGDARRLLSRTAGEASGKLSLLLGEVATFEARLYEFPSNDSVLDYFRWRQEDMRAKAIDRYCAFMLAQQGAESDAVPRILEGLGPDEKVELLRQNALDFQTVPPWQRHGACVRIRRAESTPTGENAANAARMVVDLNLPSEDGFAEYVRGSLA